jgi:Mg2+-importing ATPase
MKSIISGRSFFRSQFGRANGALAPAATPAVELQELARLDAYRVLHRLGATDEGLLEREARRRLEEYGPNTVAYEVRKNPALRLLELFVSPLSLLLLVLATLSWLTGETGGAVVIAIIVVLATVLRKDASAGVPAEVNRLFEVRVTVRPPHVAEIPISQIVPGNIIRLSAGDMIPADLRLLSAKDLFVNEAPLTGEAMPVEKFAHATTENARSAVELPNICFMGTNVVSGTAHEREPFRPAWPR